MSSFEDTASVFKLSDPPRTQDSDSLKYIALLLGKQQLKSRAPFLMILTPPYLMFLIGRYDPIGKKL